MVLINNALNKKGLICIKPLYQLLNLKKNAYLLIITFTVLSFFPSVTFTK